MRRLTSCVVDAVVAAADFDVGTMYHTGNSRISTWDRHYALKYVQHLALRGLVAVIPTVAVAAMILYSSVSSLLGYQVLVSTVWYLLNLVQVSSRTVLKAAPRAAADARRCSSLVGVWGGARREFFELREVAT